MNKSLTIHNSILIAYNELLDKENILEPKNIQGELAKVKVACIISSTLHFLYEEAILCNNMN